MFPNSRSEKVLRSFQIVTEIKSYYHLLMILDAQNGSNPSLLSRALQERLEQLKEMIFQLLGLIYPPERMHNAYYGVTSLNPRIRANALELMDTILKRNIKRMLFPIIDESPRESVVQRALDLWDLHQMTKTEALATLCTC